MTYNQNIVKAVLLAVVFFLLNQDQASCQTERHRASILFYQLTTAQGLSDNYVNSLAVDKNGNLWIATGEGLNMFNGKTVTRYFHSEYPALQNDYHRQVICDELNRIWLLTQDGNVTMIDENRVFHHVGLYDDGKSIYTRWLLLTKSNGVVLYTRNGLFTLQAAGLPKRFDSLSNHNFSKLIIPGYDSLYKKGIAQLEPLGDDHYIFCMRDSVYTVNFKNKVIEKKYPFPGKGFLAEWDQDQVLMIDRFTNRLELINLSTGALTTPFQGLRDQLGDTIAARITKASCINKEEILLTTSKAGIYIYQRKSHKLYRYWHNAADPTTLMNNNPLPVAVGPTGWVFVGVSPNGVSYFNSEAVIGQQSFFMDKSGNSYDGFVNSILTRDRDTYFIGVGDNLLEWKRSTNTTKFIDYAAGTGRSLMFNENVAFCAFDSLGRLWISTSGSGVYVLDKNKKLVKHLVHDDTSNSIRDGLIRHMKQQPDGYMWLAGYYGVSRVDINTFKVDHFEGEPLAQSKNVDCFYTFFDDNENIWIATARSGVWHYKVSERKLIEHTPASGYLSKEVYCINKDRDGNIYTGTPIGLYIFLKNGGQLVVDDKDGLLNKRVEALLLDKYNRMWMGNDVGLSCFNIRDTSLRVFDERYGLSIQGFRISSYHQNDDDELIWGTERGLQYFYPDDLLRQKAEFRSTIYRVETRNGFHNLSQDANLDLKAGDNSLNFYFSAIDYSTNLRTFYQYKLEGEDEDWITVVDQNYVRYSSLPPGTYVFRVRASNDNKTWKDAENTVTVHVRKFFWQQTWFRILGAVLGILLIWYVVNYYRRRQIKQQEELETEMVINYFASRINSYQQRDDLLWDVAKNCISRLNFEDCVIYLLDKERNVLVQKAAWGPKMERDYTIYQPIEIPVGKGIVGHVAKTGKATLVANTAQDERYIADDARRYSEIAVPIINDGQVIGVIDSEHSRRNFFNQKHLNILSTIAVLCANQIERGRAEEEKQQAKIEVLENKQKVTESRLQSLRLQMNPHFLFNALNSIQQMILANEEMVATRYLSRFSKLLRLILIHSDKELVTLKEELEILNLYVELESVRFKDSFEYKITWDDSLDVDEIKLPTLLVQPFVENAIWHGLMHKEGDRKLLVQFIERGDTLQCIVEDNGIGREKAGRSSLATAQGTKHKSKGIAVSMERLKNLGNGHAAEDSLQIIDLKNEHGEPVGTRVEINIPILN